MATPIELIHSLIRGHTNQIGQSVSNLIGPVPRTLLTPVTSQEQRWLLLTIPGNGLLSSDEYLQQYSTVEDRQRQFLVGQNGITQFSGQPNRLYMLRGVMIVPATEAIPLTVATAGANDGFAVWIDGTLRTRGARGASISLNLSEGRHLIEIILDTNSFAVHLPPNISVIATDDALKAPVWARVEAGYIDPVLGTPGVKLHWYNDVRAGGWAVLRRDLESIGRIVALGDAEASNDYVLTIATEENLALTLATGDTLYAGFAPIGVIRFVSYDPDAVLNYDGVDYTGLATVQLRLLAGRLEPQDVWVGRDASSGVFREITRVQRIGSHSTVSWVDTGVVFNNGYEYALQAFGLFDPGVLSPLSAVIYVRAGDDDPPGSIELQDDYPRAFAGRITVKFRTPEDADYAGVRTYFEDQVATGTSPGGSTGTTFVLAEPPTSSVIGAQILITDGTGVGQSVQVIAINTTDTTGKTLDIAPSFAPIPDETSVYTLTVFKPIITDYGLPDTPDEFDFVREQDEEGNPRYGLYRFVTFDHAQNQQNFADGVVWEYDSSDDACDAPVPPFITLRQLSTEDVVIAAAEGRVPSYVADAGEFYAVIEVDASDSCDGKRGVTIEYRWAEQWDGNSTGGNSTTTLNDTQRTDALTETGTATGFNQTDPKFRYITLQDTSKTWTENFFSDHQGIVKIIGGKNVGQESFIVGNTIDTLILSPGWIPVTGGEVDNTSVYEITYHNTEDTSDDPWVLNELRNYIVEITDGFGEDQLALVVNNTQTQLQLAPLQTLEPYYIGRGSASKVESGDMTPGLPRSIEFQDVLVCLAVQRDNVVPTMDPVWQQIFSISNGLNMQATAWWTRKQVGSNPPTTITRALGDTGLAQIIALRGLITTGTPITIFATEPNATDLKTITYPSVTAPAANSIAVLVGFAGDDGYSLNITDSALELTERIDTNTAAGGDAGLVVSVSEAFSGATGTGSAVYSLPQRHVGATLVFQGRQALEIAPAWDPLRIPTTGVYQVAWIGNLPASAPEIMDDPQANVRGRLIVVDKREDNNFITVRARDKDGNLSGELSYAIDFDTFPEVVSVDIRFRHADETTQELYVDFTAVVDDDTQSVQWWVDPPDDNFFLVPTETFPETVSPLTETKSFLRSFPFRDGEVRTLFIRPFPLPDAQGEPGVDWFGEVALHPRTTLVIENKDDTGAYSATQARLTFKVHPRIEEEPVAHGVITGVSGTNNQTIIDALGDFPVDANNNGFYNYRAVTHNWYFIEITGPETSPAFNKLRRIASNTATSITVDSWTQDNPGLPQVNDTYRLWRGATYWRQRLQPIVGSVEPPATGPWSLINDPHVIDRSGLQENYSDILIDYFSVITGIPPEPIKTSGLDPDELAEILEYDIDEYPPFNIFVKLEVWDDDLRHWRLYAKKNSWPVLSGDPEDGPLDEDFLRLDTPITIQQQASMKVEEGTWYVIVVPYNSYEQEGPRIFESVVADGIREAQPPTYNGQDLKFVALQQVAPDGWLYLWQMVAPETGTFDLDLSIPLATQASMVAAVYTGVDQLIPHAGAQKEADLAQTVPSADGSSLCLVVMTGGVTEETGSNGTFTGGTGTTVRAQTGTTSSGMDYDVVIGDEPGASTQNVDYTHNAAAQGGSGSIAVSLIRADTGTAVTYVTGGSANTGSGLGTSLQIPLTVSGSNRLLLVGVLLRAGASEAPETLQNFAIERVVPTGVIGGPYAANKLSWTHPQGIEDSNDYLVDITVQDVSRTSVPFTIVTNRNARLDYDGDANNPGDPNSTPLTGSIVHNIALMPNGSVTAVQPNFVLTSAKEIRWKYTIRLHNASINLDKELTYFYTGRYVPLYGDLGGTNPTLSNFTATMVNGGACVLTGGTTYIANPGITYNLTWEVADPDDANWHTRVMYTVYDTTYSPLSYQQLAVIPSTQTSYVWSSTTQVASAPDSFGPAVWNNSQYFFGFRIDMIRKSDGLGVDNELADETRWACFCNGTGELFPTP